MKPYKIALRVWILITSLVGFLGGWVMLAHAQKPAPLEPPAQMSAPLPTLAPLPPLPDGSQQLQPIQPLPLMQSFLPRLRTGGS